MENVIIIGTGPAGYTAAIYTARADLKPLVLTGTQPGGQLTTTTEVENFPGFPEGITGPDLMVNMQQQAERFGARVEFAQIDSLVKEDDGTFTLNAGATTYQSKAVIICSGASARYLGLPGEDELVSGGHGLTACATCDGAFYRDVPVCVIGGGDSACEEAMFLTKFASKVYLIHRRDELRASKIMAQRLLDHEKVSPVWNATIKEYLTDDKGDIRALLLEDTQDGSTSELEVKGVFMAIGHTPNTAFLGDLVNLDDGGYILPEHGARTNVEGLYTAGDVSDQEYRQAITAAGAGCAAAIEVERWLAEQD
ncbi:thioredoxin-disulfide reductase [Verrucomicrobiaceae bacterium N1E253]|uniref:Thioredoxin reductase n=1 Tax=Oceaniferula marina TaxID=2748318 RepID=A0A851GSD8_9BACT|nr:thioredoxin-disulfide reductase [Oceaniferula marina]NWK57154.1 thioredoxin-disulfide reductase [Oceaniferula marina]